MGKKVGVVLSGCGVYDGAEIHETVVVLLAIDRLVSHEKPLRRTDRRIPLAGVFLA